MRGRTANELQKRANILLVAIQREYDEIMKKKTKVSPANVTIATVTESSSTSDKENDKDFEENKVKKAKRKSWMPTISFALPDDDEPKAKKAVISSGLNASASTSYASTSNAVASTSASTNNPFAISQKSIGMPLLIKK